MNRLVTTCVGVVAVVCFGLLGFLGIGPHTGLYRTVTVLSGSMRPGIPEGAVLVETPIPGRDLRVGQVVTYTIPVDDHRVVTHRVVRIVSGGAHPVFQTKGDANDTADPWQEQVTGADVWQVRAVVPGLGFGIHWLRVPAVQVVGVFVLPAFLAVCWVIGIWRDDDEPDLDAALGAAT
ncbi:MAG: signal peptidase [Actinomycetota bacterium]|nr:signal peptidase [Actinomycetota bacterium]